MTFPHGDVDLSAVCDIVVFPIWRHEFRYNWVTEIETTQRHFPMWCPGLGVILDCIAY